MNNYNYFSHDSNARNSEKLIQVRMKFGAEGYGIYFMIIERLREEAEYMSVLDYNVLAFDLRVDTSKVKSIVEDFGLFAFTDDGKCFYSESLLKRMEIKDGKSKKRSEAGKKGAEKRWGKNSDGNSISSASGNTNDNANSNAIAMLPKKIASKVKESKVKESKDNAVASEPAAHITFQKLWMIPNIVQTDDLNRLIELYGDELVDAAIKLAGRKNVSKGRAIGFLTSSLQEWADNNVKTIDQAREYQRQRPERRNYSKRQFVREEIVPERFLKDDVEPQLDPSRKAELENKLAEYLEKGAKKSE
ncbi:Lin1244/Lin1753 domain-containing protein [Enterococcus sp.]|uniref:Lin1244/Lin1753 domain-containing protein n=1 Tax=Enterococcus sp. TaxID=35783 RepID=UPI00289B1985|nr:Lin1244/Lin1753 domain-containing protein [Enterococcus sp.]